MPSRYRKLLSWLFGIVAFGCLLVSESQAEISLPSDGNTWSAVELLGISTPGNWETLNSEERHAVVDCVWSSYLVDGGEAAPINLDTLFRLIERFGHQLDLAQQNSLKTVLKNRIDNSPSELAGLGLWDIWRMRRVAASLGTEELAIVAWTATYLDNNNTMLDGAGSTEIGLLLDWTNQAEKVLRTDLLITRQSITAYIDMLSSETGERSSSALYAHIKVLQYSLSNASEQERTQLAQKLTSLVSQSNEAFYGMSLWDHHYLRKTAFAADINEETISDWTLDWVINSNAWMHGVGFQEINALSDWIHEARARPRAREAEYRLVGYLRDRLMIDPSILATVEPEGMGLARVLRYLAPRLDDEELEQLAVYVANQFAVNGGIDGEHWDYENVSCLFDTPELRQHLRDQLVDPNGMPRINVAKLFTWMQRGTLESVQWREEIEQLTQDAQLTPNQRARWLIVKANALSPEGLSLRDTADPNTPRTYAEEAYRIASDEATKFECLKWIVEDDLKLRRKNDASALLSIEISKYSDVGILEAIRELQHRVSVRKSNR